MHQNKSDTARRIKEATKEPKRHAHPSANCGQGAGLKSSQPEAGLAKGPFCVEFACFPRVP